jgi:molybdenum cofactor cytidylyltransferase
MPGRLFAIIPAAGHSRRMGQPKLLLPLGTKTVLGRLLEALRHPRIARTVVIVRPDDAGLKRVVELAGATVIQPAHDPAEMRNSVEIGLQFLEDQDRLTADDGWILVPGDHPVLDPVAIDQLVSRWKAAPCPILIPTFQGRRGHPTFFSGSLAREVPRIPVDCGLNWLVRQHAAGVLEHAVDSPAVLTDLDTPDDYARLLAEFGASPAG